MRTNSDRQLFYLLPRAKLRITESAKFRSIILVLLNCSIWTQVNYLSSYLHFRSVSLQILKSPLNYFEFFYLSFFASFMPRGWVGGERMGYWIYQKLEFSLYTQRHLHMSFNICYVIFTTPQRNTYLLSKSDDIFFFWKTQQAFPHPHPNFFSVSF